MTLPFARGVLAPLVALALTATIAVDVTVAVTRDDTSATPVAYADGVRSIADTVYDVVAPLQRIVDALSVSASTNALDIYAARDALALPTSSTQLDQIRPRLLALHAPDGSSASGLPQRFDALRRAVTAFRDDARVVAIPQLRRDLLSLGGQRLSAAVQGWNNDIRAVFVAAHRPLPRLVQAGDFSNDAPTTSSWVFGTDEACLQAFAGVYVASRGFRRDQPTALRAVAAVLDRLRAELAQVRAPATPLVRTSVSDHLTAITAEADALRAIAAAGPPPTGPLLRRLHQSLQRLAALNRGFRRLHVVACVNTVAILGGGRPSGPGDPRTLGA